MKTLKQPDQYWVVEAELFVGNGLDEERVCIASDYQVCSTFVEALKWAEKKKSRGFVTYDPQLVDREKT